MTRLDLRAKWMETAFRYPCGPEHHLVSLSQPEIFDAAGEPTMRAPNCRRVAINTGNDGQVMLAIQVIEHHIRNPFRRDD